jgi:hypothetical protein
VRPAPRTLGSTLNIQAASADSLARIGGRLSRNGGGPKVLATS